MKLGQLIGFFAIVVSLYILWQIRDLLLLLFAAIVLATALNRLSLRLQRSGMQHGLAVLCSIALLLALIVGFFWLIVPPFAVQFEELTQRVPQGFERLNNWTDYWRERVPTQLVPYLPDVDSISQQVQPLLNRLLGGSVAFFSSSLGVILRVLLVLVLTGMLLANPQAYRKGFVRLFPSFYRRRVDGILDQCEVALGRWLGGALISMSVVALMSMVGLSILRIPSPLAQGILAGVLNLIPNLGPTISVIPPMAIALLEAPWKSAAVFGLYFAIQQIESNFLTPYVMAQQVSLLPAVTLLSQVFFATFFGFLGLFLALPLTVVGQIWVKEVLIKDVLDQWRSDRKEVFDAKGTDLSDEAAEFDQETGVLPEANPPINNEPNLDDVSGKDKK
ncbi:MULTISPECIES: AI-2E family transporter [Cyanophyceae]|uniref:AI-2E family transporter n=1 Tax=Cyanophyceae TaxID=3028117 RepID=UPI001686A92C|nr:AI-2E family transporter [Trichocoleus sp. FACHB-69]MBD1933893.1 AI-2E family transporter [Trichocoleus sp. FACHB-69]